MPSTAQQAPFPASVLTKVRSHFWPWLLDTQIFDADAIRRGEATRPFLKDPRHRLCYIPAPDHIMFSTLASFDRNGLTDDPYLHISIHLSVCKGAPEATHGWFGSGPVPNGIAVLNLTPQHQGWSELASAILEVAAPANTAMTLIGISDGDVGHWRGPGPEAIRRRMDQED